MGLGDVAAKCEPFPEDEEEERGGGGEARGADVGFVFVVEFLDRTSETATTQISFWWCVIGGGIVLSCGRGGEIDEGNV